VTKGSVLKHPVKRFSAKALPKLFRFIALSFVFFIKEDRLSPFKPSEGKRCMILESGTKGWETLFYEQLLISAKEELTDLMIYKLEIKNRGNYSSEQADQIREINPCQGSYIFCDPRTGSQSFFRAVLESFRTLLVLRRRGLVPLVLLTDFPIRRWRIQAGILTARNGLILTLSSNDYIYPIMPHNRVFGPYIFPFSQSLLLAINNGIKTVKNRSHDVIVVGSLYEPRTTIVRELTDQLKKKGIHLYKSGGSHASLMRISNTEYWSNLEDSKICFTTADHAVETKGDYLHVRHLIYRYLEALACGCILVAQHVPSADHILEVGFDYLDYENIEEAVEKISSLLKDENVLQEMINRNHLKFATIIQNFGFWKFAMNSLELARNKDRPTC
jgi:hypothetical protein